MAWGLRPAIVGVAAAGLFLGLTLATSTAHASARPVKGNASAWDQACAKSPASMPVGDLGNGVNGYVVTNGDSSGTVVCCNSKRCTGEDELAPQREAPPKPIIDTLAGTGQLGGGADQSKLDPLDVLQGQ